MCQTVTAIYTGLPKSNRDAHTAAAEIESDSTNSSDMFRRAPRACAGRRLCSGARDSGRSRPFRRTGAAPRRCSGDARPRNLAEPVSGTQNLNFACFPRSSAPLYWRSFKFGASPYFPNWGAPSYSVIFPARAAPEKIRRLTLPADSGSGGSSRSGSTCRGAAPVGNSPSNICCSFISSDADDSGCDSSSTLSSLFGCRRKPRFRCNDDIC